MNTRKLFYGVLTFLVLAVTACTSTSTTEEDELYLTGIKKSKIKIKKVDPDSIKKSKIKIKKDED